jgi:hypothetical protein
LSEISPPSQVLTTLQENEEAKADLLRQFTDLQSTKIRLESDLIPLQEKIDLQKHEAEQAEERRQAIYVSSKFAMGPRRLVLTTITFRTNSMQWS